MLLNDMSDEVWSAVFDSCTSKERLGIKIKMTSVVLCNDRRMDNTAEITKSIKIFTKLYQDHKYKTS